MEKDNLRREKKSRRSHDPTDSISQHATPQRRGRNPINTKNKASTMKTLIVYFSKHGQTEAIAKRIAVVMDTTDQSVEIVSVTEAHRIDSLDVYDIVILGSPIYLKRHSKRLKRFVGRHLGSLRKKQTAFFSVSLSAAGDATQRKDAFDCMNSFLESCNWSPSTTEIFAGALPYSKYNWLTRWIMKRIARKAGGDMDTSRDYEFTNWNKVETFAKQIERCGNSAHEESASIRIAQ